MKREQEALVEKIAGLEAEAIEAREAVESLIAAREEAVAAIAAEKAKEEARYAAMQRESARLGAILAARARAARLAAARARAAGRSGYTSGGGALSWPVSAGVTSAYGMRVHPVTGVYKLHDGTDFGVGCGTPVRAAASGTVIQAANVAGYGNQLVIDHGAMRGAGVATSYNHLMSFRRATARGSAVARSSATAAAARACTAPATRPAATCTSWCTSTAARLTRWAGCRSDRSGTARTRPRLVR